MEERQSILDHIVNNIYLVCVLGTILSLMLILFAFDKEFIFEIISRSRSSIPSIAFSLLGFAITSLSILTSLKSNPFFIEIQAKYPFAWRNMVRSFTTASIIYSVFGSFSLFTKDTDFKTTNGLVFTILSTSYLSLIFMSFFVTVSIIHLISLIANASSAKQENSGHKVTNIFDKSDK